jgi:hypothetical protein
VIVFAVLVCVFSQVKIRNISPPMGPTSGNTRVVVRGEGLQLNPKHQHPICKFGTNKNTVPATYIKCTPEPQNVNEMNPDTKDLTDDCL